VNGLRVTGVCVCVCVRERERERERELLIRGFCCAHTSCKHMGDVENRHVRVG